MTADYFTASDQRQVVLVGRWMGLASMLGSTYIILLIAGSAIDRSTKLQTTFYRFLLLLSIFDVISSFGYFLSTWMVPSEPPEGMDEAIGHIFDYDAAFPWAAGNRATCTLQGMLLHVGMVGSCLFTGFISLHYVFAVRYRWSDDNMRRMETICYVIGFLVPLGSAIYLAAMGLFNPYSTGFCWINQYPVVCDPFDYSLDETGSIEAYCNEVPNRVSVERADTAMLFFVWPIMVSVFLIVVVSMWLLYHGIRDQEKRLSTTGQAGEITQKALKRGMLLIFNYVVMYVPLIVASGIYTKAGSLVNVIFLACQGVLNAFVYSGCAEWCMACPFRLVGQEDNMDESAEKTVGEKSVELTPSVVFTEGAEDTV